MFALSAYVSYGLQFYVLVQIVWPFIDSRLENETLKKHGEYLLRFVFICLMCKYYGEIRFLNGMSFQLASQLIK